MKRHMAPLMALAFGAGIACAHAQTPRRAPDSAPVAPTAASTAAAALPSAARGPVVKYVRYSKDGKNSYGILEGDTIRQLDGVIFDSPKPTGVSVKLAEVKLLAPCEPKKVIGVGLNYKTHLGDTPEAEYPGLFAKFPTSIVGPEAGIIYPRTARNIHYEAEMVVVIGKTAKHVRIEDAPDYIFGVTCGDDVSERDWQMNDLQWFRGKVSDTFGPIGPAIVTGLNYNDLLVQSRLNGEPRQSQRTSDMLFNVSYLIEYLTEFMTLEPGDLIFTGTPGMTRPMTIGDTIEVEVEGVGVLRNTVVVDAIPPEPAKPTN